MNEEIAPLTIFVERMKKIGIDLKFIGNFPWVYFDTINGIKVTEKFYSDHGFVIGFLPIRWGHKFKFHDLPETFKLIRKYREIQKETSEVSIS